MHGCWHQCHMAVYTAHTTNQRTHLLTAQTKKRQEPHKRAYLSDKGGLGKNMENGPKAEKDKTEIATGLGRRTTEEIQKSGIKLAALRVQTGGRHQK